MDNRFIHTIEIDWEKIDESSYLKDIKVLCKLERLEFDKHVTFFVGENGTGKSTLLEAIAVAYGFNPEGGTMNYRFDTYNDVSELSAAVSITKGFKRPCGSYFFRAESFFNVATKEKEYDKDNPYGHSYGDRGLHNQSHGESFLAFFQSFNREGLYIMDEPEAALSPQRQLTLFIQIAQMAAAGSQFIIASHSPILLGLPGADILSFDDGYVHPCVYEETESYQITKMFINNRNELINHLLR